MRDQDPHHHSIDATIPHHLVYALLGGLLLLTVLVLASCPASGQQLRATSQATAAQQPPAPELPWPVLTPGAVRASASLPGCPVALPVPFATFREAVEYIRKTQHPTADNPWAVEQGGFAVHPAHCPGPVTTAEVCATHGTRQFRRTAGVTKRSVCAAYGVSAADCPGYEDDHLVPLELGGSDARENHWPQPRGSEWDAGRKDWLENELRRLVCGGVLPIERAWRCVAEEWTKCWVLARAGRYDAMGVE